MATITERIRAMCKASGTTISKMEQDLGYSNGYLNPKKTKTIPSDRLVDIAKYLDVSVYELLDTEEIPAANNGDGLSEEELDLIRLFRSSSPHIRAAMLDLLRSAEAGQSAPDAYEANK